MKKFMYAALFLGALSSCSNDDDVIENGANSQPAEDGKTVIALAVANNNSYAIETRGIGMVGGLNETTNKWNGESLYILMTDSGEVTPVEPDYTYPGIEPTILNNVKVTAPNATAGLVTAAETGHYYYYPTVGMFDFYGYHVDDAAGANPAPQTVGDSIVLNVTIDGSQDLMVAKADYKADSAAAVAANPSDWYAKSYKYSAYAARRGVQPTLKFNHLLTQLQFNVINKGTTTRMWVDSIGVTSKNVAEMVVAGKNHGNIKWTGDEAMLYVKNDYDDADRVLDSLAKVPLFAPNAGGTDTIKAEKTKIGNLLVAASNYQEDITEYEGHIILLQDLKVTEKDEDGNVTQAGRQEVIKDTVTFTIKLPSDKFLAQHAYTVNITVYGLKMIEVTAELTRWENGGSFDITPEDQETTGEDAVYKEPVIKNAAFITDKESFDKYLPESYKTTRPWDDNSTPASLPWLVVFLTDSYTGDLNVKVQGPEYDGVAYNKEINWASVSDVTFFTLNGPRADELDVTDIKPGVWTVTVNGGDATEIVVANN